MLKWAREHGCEWDAATCACAASGGHLKVLKWARASTSARVPCPWDERTCSYAAHCGHLKVLRWARAHGCPWDAGTPSFAARGGRGSHPSTSHLNLTHFRS